MQKILMILALIVSPAMAGDKITANVEGMVCDFCARGLEKVFSKQDEVENIDVSLEAGIVIINMKDGSSITDAKLTELINSNGLNVTSIER